MKSVFILCAGEQRRFPKDFIPKQLLRIRGQRLLDRIINQCRECGISPCIVSHRPMLRELSHISFEPTDRKTILRTIKSTSQLWTDNNLFLLGDVYYPDDLFHRIWTCPKPIVFWLNGSEVFALAFQKESASHVLEKIEFCNEELEVQKRNKLLICVGDRRLWHLYRAISGANIHEHVIYQNHFTNLCEGAFDVDSYRQYLDLIKAG